MFHAKLDKEQKIFFYAPVSKFQNILTLNICKVDLSKKKKDFKERYSTIFGSSRLEVYSKNGVLKKLTTCFLACH